MSVVTAPSNLVSPNCSKRGGAEHGIIERGGAEADDGILVRAFESFLIRAGNPQREQAQDATGLLKPWQRLPFALKDGNDRRMKWIGGGELRRGRRPR